jgi:hypothetical protein
MTRDGVPRTSCGTWRVRLLLLVVEVAEVSLRRSSDIRSAGLASASRIGLGVGERGFPLLAGPGASATPAKRLNRPSHARFVLYLPLDSTSLRLARAHCLHIVSSLPALRCTPSPARLAAPALPTPPRPLHHPPSTTVTSLPPSSAAPPTSAHRSPASPLAAVYIAASEIAEHPSCASSSLRPRPASSWQKQQRQAPRRGSSRSTYAFAPAMQHSAASWGPLCERLSCRNAH